MIYKNFYEPVYRATVLFLAGGTREELDSWYKKRKIKQDQDGYARLDGIVDLIDSTQQNGVITREYLVYIEDANNFYTLSHECIHLVKHIFKDRGVPFREENDEAIAYYHTYWLKKLWRLLSKYDASGKKG